MTRPPNWGDLERGKADEPAPVPSDIAQLTRRLFSTRDGLDWLDRMCEIKFFRDLDPNVPQSALVHLEGQRQFLRDIKRWVAQAQPAPRKEPK